MSVEEVFLDSGHLIHRGYELNGLRFTPEGCKLTDALRYVVITKTRALTMIHDDGRFNRSACLKCAGDLNE